MRSKQGVAIYIYICVCVCMCVCIERRKIELGQHFGFNGKNGMWKFALGCVIDEKIDGGFEYEILESLLQRRTLAAISRHLYVPRVDQAVVGKSLRLP